MNRKILVTSACMMALLCMVISGPSFAASRGIEVAGVKTDSGQRMDLYDASHALVVGVGDYEHWPSLEQVPLEISKVSRVLRKKGFTVKEIVNPDDKELEAAFNQFIDNYGYNKKNRLLFFYAGHGYTMDDGKSGYLVPKNAPDPRKDDLGFLRTALNMNQILAWCRNMRAKHALFLFDSCFSGTIFKQRDLPDTPPAISRLAEKEVRQFITAGTAGEPVPASSTFTPAFVDALEYGLGDLNKDGYISGTELGLYLQDEVPKHVRQTPQYGKISDYTLSRGDYIFLAGSSAYYPESDASSSSGSDAPSAGDTWTEPVTGMEFVWVPGGCFQMGQTKNEKQFLIDQIGRKKYDKYYGNELPRHKVCLDGFWMGKYEVTQGEWKKIMDNNPSLFDSGDNYPVETVSWNDCQDFIDRLNKKSNREFHLPSESQWEYAARSGDKREKYAGGNNVDRVAWYSGNSGGHTHEVGTKAPNGLGIYDMSGNVWEWVEDKWHGSYRGAPADGSAWVAGSETRRVVRGGCFGSFGIDYRDVRVADRHAYSPEDTIRVLGFRLCFSR